MQWKRQPDMFQSFLEMESFEKVLHTLYGQAKNEGHQHGL